MDGHTENVCALAVTKDNLIISGSWDKTAKIWKDGKCIHTLVGHEFAVWGVVQLENLLVATASADKTIRLWNNGVQTKVLSGHNDVVRTLAIVPSLGFASCSNDGTLRVWDNNGTALYELHGHTSFVYSISVLPNGEIVSSGEDRSVRVWNGANEIQMITLPCVSVWSVASLSNGDIAVGGSDAVVRVFTRDIERLASAEELEVFQASLSAVKIPSNQVGDLNTEKLSGVEALAVPGKKDGEVKMLRIDVKVIAYQWSGGENTWIEIGEVTDAVGSTRKQIYQGKEYDYVFDVDIQEGAPPIKLPYNLNQNPFEAAQEFIDKHELPQGYLDQIGNFIISNAQNIVIGAQPAQPSRDPWSMGNSSLSGESKDRKSPLIPQTDYIKLKTIKTGSVLQKIKQLNSELENNSCKLSAANLTTLENIMSAIDTNSVKAAFGDLEWEVLHRIISQWPVEKCFPGLDVLRTVVCETDLPLQRLDFSSAFERFYSNSNFSDQTLQTNLMLICRVLVNSFPHKSYVLKLREGVIKV